MRISVPSRAAWSSSAMSDVSPAVGFDSEFLERLAGDSAQTAPDGDPVAVRVHSALHPCFLAACSPSAWRLDRKADLSKRLRLLITDRGHCCPPCADSFTPAPAWRPGRPLLDTRKSGDPAVIRLGPPDLRFQWGERRDLNPRHPGPQPGALPAELRPPSSPDSTANDSTARRQQNARCPEGHRAAETSIAVRAPPRVRCPQDQPNQDQGRRTAPRSPGRWRNPVPAAVRTASPGSTGAPARFP